MSRAKRIMVQGAMSGAGKSPPCAASFKLFIFKYARRSTTFRRVFSPCSDGCLAFPCRHGSKTTSFPSDFRIMVTFSPS